MSGSEPDSKAPRGETQPARALRVCIIAHHSRTAGGLSVAQNMVSALGRAAPQHTYLVTMAPGCGYEEICSKIPRCQTVVREPAGLLGEWLYETFRLPKVVRGLRPDVILALGNRGLIDPPSPQAVLVEDPHLFYPVAQYGLEKAKRKMVLRYHKRFMSRQLRNTELLLCQTRVVERRMRQTYGYAGRVEICPNAMPALALRGESDPPMPEPLAPYADKLKLFCLSRYYAHKNLEIIPTTFQRFRSELEGVVVVTTTTPDDDPSAPRFFRLIEKWNLSDRIINLGRIPQSEVGSYYRHCQAMFMPTLLESFSTTYIEAMHFGAPILTSDLDFAHAVCGEAALYFDPWSPESIRDAILRLKSDESLAADLARKGAQRLRDMPSNSWDQVAGNVAGWLGEIASK